MFTRKNIICALLIGCMLQTSARANIVPALGCAIGATAATLLYKNPQWRAMMRKKLSTNDKVLWALHALSGAVLGASAGVGLHKVMQLSKVLLSGRATLTPAELRAVETELNDWYINKRADSKWHAPNQRPVVWKSSSERRIWECAERIFLTRTQEEQAMVDQFLRDARERNEMPPLFESPEEVNNQSYIDPSGVRILHRWDHERRVRARNRAEQLLRDELLEQIRVAREQLNQRQNNVINLTEQQQQNIARLQQQVDTLRHNIEAYQQAENQWHRDNLQ